MAVGELCTGDRERLTTIYRAYSSALDLVRAPTGFMLPGPRDLPVGGVGSVIEHAKELVDEYCELVMLEPLCFMEEINDVGCHSSSVGSRAVDRHRSEIVVDERALSPQPCGRCRSSTAP